MGYKATALRFADSVARATLARFPLKPTLYCGRLTWIPAPIWETVFSRYELPVARAIQTYLRRGQTYWDVGANVGWFSIFASKIVGPYGHVFSFEPSPEVFKILSTATDWLPNIKAVPCGLGNANDVRSFAAQGASSSSSFISDVTQINAGFLPSIPITSVSVAIRTADALLEELEVNPTLVKIDVEGFELEVLRGAQNLLSSVRPTLIIEVHPPQLILSGGNETALFDLLRSHSYAWSEIDRNPNSLYTIVAQPMPS